MIQVGDTLPDAQLFEYLDDARAGCTPGPNALACASRRRESAW